MHVPQFDLHPASRAFSLMIGPVYDAFVADIKARGLIDDIVLVRERGKRLMLDGKNRLRACGDSGVEPRFVDFDGDDPWMYCASVNLARRHMNESQRALAAAHLARNAPGRQTRRSAGLKTSQASHLLNVGERSVERARQVIRHGVPELVLAVEQGTMAVTKAAELATHSKRDQRAELAAAAARDASPRPRPIARPEQQQQISSAVRITESETVAINALLVLGDHATDPRARAGAAVVRKLVPWVKARTRE